MAVDDEESAGSTAQIITENSLEPEDMDVVEERLGSGSLAAVEYVRMRDEIDALKKVCNFVTLVDYDRLILA